MTIETPETREGAHGLLRRLSRTADADVLLPLARYLANGGHVHWRAAALAHQMDAEAFEDQNDRDLLAAIRCSLANGDDSGLRYLLNM